MQLKVFAQQHYKEEEEKKSQNKNYKRISLSI
jgi:hypothetical protein